MGGGLTCCGIDGLVRMYLCLDRAGPQPEIGNTVRLLAIEIFHANSDMMLDNDDKTGYLECMPVV